MFKGAKLSQDLSVTKSYFECSIWILSVMHTAFYKTKQKAVVFMLMLVWFCCTDLNVLSQMGGSHTFPGWRTVKSFKGWTHPSLANLEGQLHAQRRLEGVKIAYSASKTHKLCVIGCLHIDWSQVHVMHVVVFWHEVRYPRNDASGSLLGRTPLLISCHWYYWRRGNSADYCLKLDKSH